MYFAVINAAELVTALTAEGICAGATVGTLVVPGVGEVAGAATAVATGAVAIASVRAGSLAKSIGTSGDKLVQSEQDVINNVYNSIKQSPKYPKGFHQEDGIAKKNIVKNKELLDKLREIESGEWSKIYKDGYDTNNRKISIHYFQSKSGKVFNVKVKYGWSNR